MHLIGVFSNNKEFDYINTHINKSLKDKNLKILNINENSINNMKNIVFETIIITQELHLDNIQKNILKKICNNCKYIIINSDRSINIDLKENILINCITYGVNQKATITISSIQDENAIIYIQRNIYNIEGKIVEMGESSINIKKYKKLKIENLLAIFSILVIYDL